MPRLFEKSFQKSSPNPLTTDLIYVNLNQVSNKNPDATLAGRNGVHNPAVRQIEVAP